MTLDNMARQRLHDATRQHRSRLGLDPTTGRAASNTVTRRSVMAAVFAGIASRFGMRGSK